MNVRLDEERLRKAQRLRERGVAISDLVRKAIDERFDAIRRPQNARDVTAAVTGLLERFRIHLICRRETTTSTTQEPRAPRFAAA